MDAHTTLALRSLVTADGHLELSLASEAVPAPGTGDVLIRVEAAPINPSDIGLLLGPADMGGIRSVPGEHGSRVIAPIPAAAMASQAARVGIPMAVGNEGAGIVVAAGSSPEAQRLLGRTVAVMGGGMYSQYRCVRAADCLVLPEGTTPAQGASCFVNPLTALGFVETLRDEGHGAIVQIAAASNLGQMLLRICLKDGIPLVNIVRSAAQAQLLRAQGARHVCDSTSPVFREELTEAIATTGATLAFDPTGGGPLGGQVLSCMESALRRRPGEKFSRYGSKTFKQLYVYGGLDPRPLELPRDIGMAWGAGGWLLFHFLEKAPAETVRSLKARVADELTSTFASHYTRSVSLSEALQPEVIEAFSRRSTGEKFLLEPWKDLVR
ncbi:zinc-binding dehydrogenase [Ramlibacter sp.]|uniref:zinc-binding dehydrogenase n=1 Tax=Ramlibacter sp. TaxID=1917967 RepID=UPI003D0EBD1D